MNTWTTRPISPTCEVLAQRIPDGKCGLPATHAYPCMGNGWMALCHRHAEKHLPHASPITELILKGETLHGQNIPLPETPPSETLPA